jgi:spermidine synthase
MPKTEHWHWYVEEFSETERHHHAVEEVYFAGATAFQDVAVLRSTTFGKMLILDGDTQSSQGDERIYHESLVHPALAAIPDRSEILILGGGEGATLREVLRSPDVRRCTMVDIDGDVVSLARRFLPEWSEGALDDPRASLVIADALRYLAEDRSTYGAILSDLTEPLPDSPSHAFFRESAFTSIKARLHPEGIYVLQASTAGFHNLTLHAKMARSLRKHYQHVVSFSAHVPSLDNEWAFLACSDVHDLRALAPSRLEGYLASLSGENFFYDVETHRRIFSLPLYFRRELAKSGDVFS